MKFKSEPIIAGYNIDTLKKTEGQYGVNSGGLDFPAKVIKDKSISGYADDCAPRRRVQVA